MNNEEVDLRNWKTFLTTTFTLILTLGAWAGVSAQAQPDTTPTTGVLVFLTVKPDTPRPDIMKVMPSEVRHTVSLYLDGKISQWYARDDGRGVVFMMNCSTVAEAQAITDTLPLTKANLATFEYVALKPLTPLRMLIAEPQVAPKK